MFRIRFVMLVAIGALSLPLTPLTQSRAAVWAEDFANDPVADGWNVFGEGSLFRWDAAAGSLAVIWDSSKPNSYFQHSLPTVLTKRDDFSISFALVLSDVAVGITPDRPYSFEIAIGLLNRADAMSGAFQRGTGQQSPNLVEFDYFPDSGFGATISPVIVSTNNQFIPSFTFPLELTANARFEVTMKFTAADQTLRTVMTRDGQPFSSIKDVVLPATFTDFRIDTVSISSFSDAGGDGSVRAHGFVDNLRVETPEPPVRDLKGRFVDGNWQVSFTSRTDWNYVLESSEDLQNWTALGSAKGNGQTLSLNDPTPGISRPHKFYRVEAKLP